MQEISRLLPRHQKIMSLCLEGWTNKQIADNFAMSAQNVSIITNSPLFQDELARRRHTIDLQRTTDEGDYRSAARYILHEKAEKAAGTQVGLLDSKNESVQLKSAQAILDRVFSGDDKAIAPQIVLNADTIKVLQVAIQESFPGKELEVLKETG